MIAVGYDFGAVDVGIMADGSPIVFEVNSSPGMGPVTQQSYAQYIANYYTANGGR